MLPARSIGRCRKLVLHLGGVLIKRSKSMDISIDANLQRAAEKIYEADAIIVTAGAGMGVDSGLPDFRGPEGFWRAYPPMKRLGLTFPEISTPGWFEKDPTFAWGFFGHRYHLYNNATPHHGFQILLNWCKAKKDGYFVFTSNVDGHFQKAGFDDDKVVECHGSVNFLQQVYGRFGHIWPFPSDLKIEVDENTFRAKEPLPSGPPGAPRGNQTLARPNVFMFSDWHWIPDRSDDQQDRFSDFIQKLEEKGSRFVVIEIGAGLAVPTVRLASERLIGRMKHGTLIRINPREPEVPGGNGVSLPLRGLESLQKIKQIVDSNHP